MWRQTQFLTIFLRLDFVFFPADPFLMFHFPPRLFPLWQSVKGQDSTGANQHLGPIYNCAVEPLTSTKYAQTHTETHGGELFQMWWKKASRKVHVLLLLLCASAHCNNCITFLQSPLNFSIGAQWRKVLVHACCSFTDQNPMIRSPLPSFFFFFGELIRSLLIGSKCPSKNYSTGSRSCVTRTLDGWCNGTKRMLVLPAAVRLISVRRQVI